MRFQIKRTRHYWKHAVGAHMQLVQRTLWTYILSSSLITWFQYLDYSWIVENIESVTVRIDRTNSVPACSVFSLRLPLISWHCFRSWFTHNSQQCSMMGLLRCMWFEMLQFDHLAHFRPILRPLRNASTKC